MEAACGGTNYALPVFLICFKTPSFHAVVGAFVIHFETANCMEEALHLFKAGDPDTAGTKFWIVGHSRAETSALSSTFPGSRPLLCNFHREQAWSKWHSETESDVRDVSFVKEMLQQVALSRNEYECRSAVEALEQSLHWQGNERLQQYICQKWLLVKEFLTKKHGYASCFNDTRVLKTKKCKAPVGVAKFDNCHSVRGLARVFAKKFSLGDKAPTWQVGTSSLPSPLHCDTVSKLLRGKPTAVTTGIMESITTAAGYRRSDVKQGKEEDTFLIPSTALSSSCKEVNFSTPSSTCSNFTQTDVPREHFAAVLLVDGRDRACLPAAYKNRPNILAKAGTCGKPGQMSRGPSEMDVFDKVAPNNSPVLALGNIDGMLKTLDNASSFIKIKLDEPHTMARGAADCVSQGIGSETSDTVACVHTGLREQNMTAHERGADHMPRDAIGKTTEIEVDVAMEPNEAHMAADFVPQNIVSEVTGVTVPIEIGPSEICLSADGRADCGSPLSVKQRSEMQASAEVEQIGPAVATHQNTNNASTTESNGKLPEYVSVMVQSKELNMETCEDADAVSQEQISRASEMAICVEAEASWPCMTAHGYAEYASQDMDKKLQLLLMHKLQGCRQTTCTRAQCLISNTPGRTASVKVEPNEPLITHHESTNSVPLVTAREALGIEACIKVEPVEPHTTAEEDTDYMSQETNSKASELSVCVKLEQNEAHVTFDSDIDCALQEMVNGASEACVTSEPNVPLVTPHEDNGYPLVEIVSDASVCIKVEPTDPHTTIYDSGNYSLQETAGKATEMEECVQVQQNLQPTKLPVETCASDLEQDPERSESSIKSQIRAQVEEIDSLLCGVWDNAVLRRVLDMVSQAGKLVECSVPGCSGVGRPRRAAQGRIAAKREGPSSSESAKKTRTSARQCTKKTS
ncbi:hypothetical protein HPB50_027171 [Hyalomma asiaticum]|uniref:Uncharacterized protein n=1 Tax=Hyalomma asiaticum TaxID=266040 RepID=A0ACB7RT60_HYAAI|nr:hypothetical protein HPB50_027171 [Hyalomma asiaticum]